MNKIRILHVASFTGNIGDNASHIGLYNILSSILGDDYNVEQIEIRRFYKNYSLGDKMIFDDQFVSLANTKDLLIIGGGGFLDYWVPNSTTGTTIDISEKALEKLKVPTLFVSVGCIPHQEVPEGNVEKFHKFLKILTEKDNIKIAVRNDGSMLELHRLFGNEFDGKIREILDNGFFYKTNSSIDYCVTDKPYIAINTTLDQLTMKNRLIGGVDYNVFKKEFSGLLQNIIEKTDFTIAFIPHIYKDIQAFGEIIKDINDFYVRSRIVIAPYVQGDYGCNLLFSIYEKASAVIGMRFHTNVCSVAMGKKVVGLAALDRVVHLYNSLNMGENIIKVNTGNLSNAVFNAIMSDCIGNNHLSLEKKKENSINVYRQYLLETGVL